MKSLEIIDDLLFDFLDDAIDESATLISKSEIEQIKADLEVLEIFKKNIITIQSSPDDDYGQYQDDMFEMVIGRSFKTEDFHKVKQWLEENVE